MCKRLGGSGGTLGYMGGGRRFVPGKDKSTFSALGLLVQMRGGTPSIIVVLYLFHDGACTSSEELGFTFEIPGASLAGGMFRSVKRENEKWPNAK